MSENLCYLSILYSIKYVVKKYSSLSIRRFETVILKMFVRVRIERSEAVPEHGFEPETQQCILWTQTETHMQI